MATDNKADEGEENSEAGVPLGVGILAGDVFKPPAAPAELVEDPRAAQRALAEALRPKPKPIEEAPPC